MSSVRAWAATLAKGLWARGVKPEATPIAELVEPVPPRPGPLVRPQLVVATADQVVRDRKRCPSCGGNH